MDNIPVDGLKIFLYNANDEDTLKAYNEVKNGRKLNAADFIIRVSGQNIIITAATDLGMEVAVDFFLDNYIVDKSSTLPYDLNYVSSKFNPNKDIKLAGVSIQKYRLVVARGASYMTTLAAKELAKSVGIASALWTKASVTGGFLECDIWENFGDPFRVKHNLHTWEDSGHKNLLGGRGDTLNNAPGIGGQVEFGWEYHTIGWEWTDDYSQFYVDGQPTIRFDSTAAAFDVFNKPAWLIVGSGPSSHDYGTPVKNDFDFDIDYFDYIQIYQKDNGSVMYVQK